MVELGLGVLREADERGKYERHVTEWQESAGLFMHFSSHWESRVSGRSLEILDL